MLTPFSGVIHHVCLPYPNVVTVYGSVVSFDYLREGDVGWQGLTYDHANTVAKREEL